MSEPNQPKKVASKVKSWILDSLSSGLSFTQKLHETFLRVFGVDREGEFNPTKLERNFAAKIDQIVRKGKSPTLLFGTDEIWEAFDACVRVFPNETVVLQIKDKKGRAFPQEFNVFQSLHQYAFAFRADEQMIREHKRVLAEGTGFINRARLQRQIGEARSRNAERLSLFQRIVFAEAEAIEKGLKRRVLRIRGNPISLDQLVYFMRQKAAEAKEKEVEQWVPVPEDAQPDAAVRPPRKKPAPKKEPKPDKPTQPDPQPEPKKHAPKTISKPEVVEWEEIRNQDDLRDESNDNSFNLDF